MFLHDIAWLRERNLSQFRYIFANKFTLILTIYRSSLHSMEYKTELLTL